MNLYRQRTQTDTYVTVMLRRGATRTIRLSPYCVVMASLPAPMPPTFMFSAVTADAELFTYDEEG